METTSFNLKTDLLTQQRLVEQIIKDENTSSLFVLNVSDKPNQNHEATQAAGVIGITVMVDGQARFVRIPHSWVPIDIGLQAPKKDIRNSAEFQRALTGKYIIVLTEEEANATINADAMSREEYGRIMAIAQNVNGISNYPSGNGPVVEEEDPWANVSSNVKLQVDALQTGAMTEMEFRAYLQRNSRSISRLDRQYIIEKLPDLSLGN